MKFFYLMLLFTNVFSVTLTVNTAIAGSEPSIATASTTYSIGPYGSDYKIIGKVLSSLPTNTTVSVQLEAPALATSLGYVDLTLIDQDLVINVPSATTITDLNMDFKFYAPASAGIITSTNITFSYTLTAN